MTDEIKSQIIAIRDTGLTNMFDTTMVQRIAFEMSFYALVTYIEEDRNRYCRFIMTGKET